MIDEFIVFIITVFMLSIIALLVEGKPPTKRQKRNRRKWKQFWGDLFRGDVFMEMQFFFIGLFILTATVIVAFHLGGVL
tara:strand:+ start:2315 stop:2551 length:237 start_codon:yes stop_codon:yes gene_type:complete